jgi:hypothetical protein
LAFGGQRWSLKPGAGFANKIKQKKRGRPARKTSSGHEPFAPLEKATTVRNVCKRINRRGAPIVRGNSILAEAKELAAWSCGTQMHLTNARSAE